MRPQTCEKLSFPGKCSKFGLLPSAVPSRDAAGAQEVLQLGRHQRRAAATAPSAAAGGTAVVVDAAVGGGGHGAEEDVVAAEGDGAAPGEPHLWNGEIVPPIQLCTF